MSAMLTPAERAAAPAPTPPIPAAPAQTAGEVYRLSVEQYHAAIAAGVLGEDDACELLEGLLVSKMPKNPRHSSCTNRLLMALVHRLPQGWLFRPADPVTLGDGEPEPDGMIVRGKLEDYDRRHPGPADTAVVIEVAHTSGPRDRGIKLRSYARAGVPVYLLVDLAQSIAEVYEQPRPDAATYGKLTTITADGEVTLPLPDGNAVSFKLADVLPG